MEQLPSGTLTLLFTDIEGSTRLWEQYPQEMGTAVAEHDALIVRAAENCNGIDLRKRGEGDSHFIVFTDPLCAIACAKEIHSKLTATPYPGIGSIRVRTAIHTGQVELRDDDYFGTALNRCARMRSAAHGGQTILSEATKCLVEAHLTECCTLHPLGEHRLRDLMEPEKLYQLNVEGVPTEFPPLRTLTAAKHNLPLQLTTFVGREEQISAVGELLAQHRLVTLIGTGGTGKTRLSQHVCAELIDQFSDGVWFVSLVGISDGALIPQKIAESLPISLGGRDAMEVLLEEYEDARALLLIDNCEHLSKDAAKVLRTLLEKCPRLVFLATSREPLGIYGEYLYQVPPLDCHLLGQVPTAESVGKLEAVQLFRDRAAARLSGEDILKDSNAAPIAELCKKLEGIPLAIEQAASNLHALTPLQILQRIQKHFAMLPFDEEGVDERHRTIQATIDWSYQMLGSAEQDMFQKLSIFTGGWSLEAVEDICPDGSGDPLETLNRLIRRSLVVSEDAEWGERYYRMLEPIREYAVKKHDRAAAMDLKKKHFDWYYSLAKEVQATGLDADDRKLLKRLVKEHDNVRSALQYALSGEGHEVECLQFCIWMYRFWLRSGHIREGATWMQRAMERASGAPEEMIANAMNLLGVLTWQAGDLPAAVILCRKSFEKWEQLGEGQRAAAALANLGGIAFANADFKLAIDSYSHSIDIYRQGGDVVRLAHALENLGVCYTKLAHYDLAMAALEEAIKLHRSRNSKGELAKALDSYLGVFAMQGRILEATDFFREACVLALQVQEDFVSASLMEIGICLCLELPDHGLGAQCVGAMNLASERCQRIIEPIRMKDHQAWTLAFTDSLGKDTLRRLVREGRALGPAVILERLLMRVSPDAVSA